MKPGLLLTINAGSSSIKFAVFADAADPVELARGQVENIGQAVAVLSVARPGEAKRRSELGAADHAEALSAILEANRDLLPEGAGVAAVGHRIVHGGTRFVEPEILDPSELEALATLEPLAPLHQPHNLNAVRAAMRAFPQAVQVGCFDTSFHRNHDWEEDVFALPREWYDKGVRRYGFHGLSYQYIAGELGVRHPDLAAGRVIVAHLGNGASMCAMKGGRSVASTMGFSAVDGLPMGTRTGQIDPGVLLYFMQSEGMDAAAISDLLYRKSGLLGLSGVSNDMRTLEASPDPAAAQAIAYFAHRIRREIGALTAVLGGLDALVFTGGIGENSRLVRSLATQGMEWLGVGIDETANAANGPEIGTGRVRVLVVPTNEELVIARAASAALVGQATAQEAAGA